MRGGEQQSRVDPVMAIAEPEGPQGVEECTKICCFINNSPFFLRITPLAGTQ